MLHMKHYIKKIFAWIGFLHPSLGIKISQEAKAVIVLEYKTPRLKTFIETGTHEGWMIDRVGDQFEKVYSIELDETLYQRARERFQKKGHIKLLHGDSAMKIKEVLAELNEPTLFWLDAHGSGAITAANAPILDELEAIFAHPVREHLILIDDARHFDRKTIKMIKKMAKFHGYTFHIEDGIFRLHGN